MLTNEEYIAIEGARCPFCGGEDIERSLSEVDGAEITLEAVCASCERTWQDVYVLSYARMAEVVEEEEEEEEDDDVD